MSPRRTARRAAVAVVGGGLLVAGAAMVVLPGPGLITIALGLSVLGREFAWAAALERRVRDRIRATARKVAPGRWARSGRRRRDLRAPADPAPPVVDLRDRPSVTARRLQDANRDAA